MINTNQNSENLKRDRIKDQKMITDLENEIEYLRNQMNGGGDNSKIKIVNGYSEQSYLSDKIEVFLFNIRKKFYLLDSPFKKLLKK